MGLYTITESFNKTTTFLALIIIIFSIFYFKNKRIGLNIFLGLIISIAIISYINERNVVLKEEAQEQQNIEYEAIKPTSENIKEHNELIDFFFSIQDFYRYNPPAYEEMIDNVQSFLEVYNIINIGTKACDDYFKIADSKRMNALNALQSLIYTIPVEKMVIDKFDRAHERLETLLNKYLNEMLDSCNNNLIMNGYNIYRHPNHPGPKEANVYTDFDKEFTYQFY